ncbi:MAG TPA: HAD family phosphatase [Candidatus Saccharimonadales bacterium]|nr:HAD family phosphatase [Candidatus Saccharimonadales bacterium]
MIKAIIFDCFGVLVTEGWITFRDRHFAEGAPRQQATDLRRAADRGVLAYSEFEQKIAEMADVPRKMVRDSLQGNIPNEPLLEYIRTTLKPGYKIGVLSNAATDVMERLFTPEQRQLFDATILSYHIQTAKPDPQAYLAITDKLGVEPKDCVFVDDSEYFCMAAREQGMRVVCYQDFTQAKAELDTLLADPKN